MKRDYRTILLLIKPVFSNQKLPLAFCIRFLTKPSIMSLVTIAVLAAGVFLEFRYGNDWLPRSGASLTLYSLAMLWFWLRYTDEANEIGDTLGKFDELGKHFQSTDMSDKEAIKQRLIDIGLEYEDEKAEHYSAMFSHFFQRAPTTFEAINSVNRRLGYGQVVVAFIGTFFWAYGDLIANVFPAN